MQRYLRFSTLLVAIGLLFVLAALTSCAPDTSAPEINSEVAQNVADDQTPSDASDSDDNENGKAIAQIAFTDQACLDCHTDDVRLQELAVEDEPTESLSEGPG